MVFKDETELPKIVSIKIETTGLDEDEIAALKAIYTRDRSKLPFSLPRIMSWPSRERANDKRAMVLIKNGFLDLVDKSMVSEVRPKLDQESVDGDISISRKDLEPRVKF